MSLAWSGDVFLSKRTTDWHGSVSMGKNPKELTTLTLTETSPTEWKLTMSPPPGSIGRSEVTVCNKAEHRDFLRFEFQEMLPSRSAIPSKTDWKSHITVQVDGRVGLKSKFENSAFGLSYLPVLRHFLELKPSQRILEWGPGRSTIMLAEWSPSSSILSIEHDSEWHQKCCEVASSFSNVEVSQQTISLQPGKSGHYVTLPFHREGPFDLIFIDGRLRCDCLAVAHRVVSPEGVVLLHDAHRKNYEPGIALFASHERVTGTAILRR